jgi:glycerol-3-phosphate dehydrogenase
LREIDYLMVREWAQTADDVLWRRSKLGLHLSGEQVAGVESWFERAAAGPAGSRPEPLGE